MAIEVQGDGGTVLEVDGADHKAARVVARPLHVGASGGHYSLGVATGILPAALGANSEIFQFRNSHATKLALIRRVRIAAAVSTTMFAAGVPVTVDMVKAISWTGAGTGGTSISPAALLKRRTSQDSSGIASGDIRVATTAALGAGTKTLESLALASLVAAGPITGSLDGTIFPPDTELFEAAVEAGEHPLVLGQNEGFVIRSVAVPGTGTWTAAVIVNWAETGSY